MSGCLQRHGDTLPGKLLFIDISYIYYVYNLKKKKEITFDAQNDIVSQVFHFAKSAINGGPAAGNPSRFIA